MADDIQDNPPQGQGTEPEPQQTTPQPQPDSEPASAPEPEPAAQPEPTAVPAADPYEEVIRKAEERAFQKIASWQGRRDKDLLEAVSRVVDTRVQQVAKPVHAEPQPGTTVFDDPDRWYRQKRQEEEIASTQRAQAIIVNAGRSMDNNPVFADQKLGAEVIQEIQQNFNLYQKADMDPAVAAELMVARAAMTVQARRAQQKQNPLAANAKAKAPAAGVAPPVPKQAKAAPIKLSAEAEKLKKRWGYSDEDLAKVFGESA